MRWITLFRGSFAILFVVGMSAFAFTNLICNPMMESETIRTKEIISMNGKYRSGEPGRIPSQGVQKSVVVVRSNFQGSAPENKYLTVISFAGSPKRSDYFPYQRRRVIAQETSTDRQCIYGRPFYLQATNCSGWSDPAYVPPLSLWQRQLMSEDLVDFDPNFPCVYTHGYVELPDEHWTSFCIAVFTCPVTKLNMDILLAANFSGLRTYSNPIFHERVPFEGLGLDSFQIFLGYNLSRVIDTKRVVANSKSAILFRGANLVGFTREFTKQSFRNSAISSFGFSNVNIKSFEDGGILNH